MKIHLPEIRQIEDKVLFSTFIESALFSRVLWYSIDKEFSYLIGNYSDAPLVALLILAMAKGEDIYLEGSISERLWYTLSGQYQNILQHMFPGLKKINIFPANTHTLQLKASGVATGFSAGVDSFSLLSDHFYSSVPQGFRITHLLFNNVGSHGGGEAGEILFQKRYEHIVNITEQFNLPFLKINTNIDSFYAEYGSTFEFVKTHTLRNVSVALLLQNGIKRYLYASTFSFTDIKIKPLHDIAISDPISLPLLSTEILDILSVGSEYTRVEKTLRVAKIIDSYDKLNVCVSGIEAENCSECWKCMRTLLTLEIGGFLEKYTKVFKLAHYSKQKNQYIEQMLKSPDLLTLEIIDFAKKNNFSLLPMQLTYQSIFSKIITKMRVFK